jgi:hypothetical protein
LLKNLCSFTIFYTILYLTLILDMDYRLCITRIILRGYKVEEKLYPRVCEQKGFITTALQRANLKHWANHVILTTDIRVYTHAISLCRMQTIITYSVKL